MGKKNYDKQFKEQAVKLSYQRNSINAVARELGVSASQLVKWRQDFADYGENSFPGRGKERLTDEQREIKRLKSELKDKELDLAILKKAIAFFSRADN